MLTSLLSFQVRLIDAGFVWTEPHSQRIKCKLTIQKEVGYGLDRQHYSFWYTLYTCLKQPLKIDKTKGGHSGSVVECLTRDRGAAGLSCTGVTALCPRARTLFLA